MINLPKEYFIPPSTEVIFVADFFAEELIGGAELTSEAIIKASPYKLFKLHSHSLTEQMLKQHRDKIWIFGNYTMVQNHILMNIMKMGIKYYFFEYDFKPCVMRSTLKHELHTKKPCDCHVQPYGKFHATFMTGAKVLYWCSDKQKDKFYSLYPQFKGRTKDFTQGSTYYPETILNIRKIREKKEVGELVPENRWAILGSDSWIKGTDDAVKYCKEKKMPYVILQGLSNENFLKELAKSRGLIFFPRDIDVGSRISTECKLLGCELIVNDFVLHVTEEWFLKDILSIEEYLLDGPDRFWRVLQSDDSLK
jgi:hypothetical protein